MPTPLPGSTADLKSVGLFTAAYLLVAAIFAFMGQNWEFVYYIAVVVILAGLVGVVHHYVRLSQGVLWALSAWGLLHMIGGLVPVPAGWPINGTKAVFYSWWIIPELLKYDHVVHAYGFGVATWLNWQALRHALKASIPTGGVLTLCTLAGMGLGALNELIEFVATLAIPSTNVGGYENTGWDLVANLTGCIIAAVWIWVVREKKA